ncbi:MAG: hypothetical protein CL916_03160 [Deltaproteobacteria bacterium]|nr:hypothetical protein [Deltaproteobacteria bacterium]
MDRLEQRDNIDIIRLYTKEEALPYRTSFVGAYQSIFAEPPYSERFYPMEAEAIFDSNLHTPENITLLAVNKESVVGFAFAIPLRSRQSITSKLRGLLPIQHTFYLAELGVLDLYRRKGIGRTLTQWRINLIDTDAYNDVVLRTSVVKDSSYQMYLSMNFDDTGVYTEVSSRRTDGMVRTDRRLFLSRQLTQES